MNALAVNIPEEILITAKIPRNKWENEIKKELALQMRAVFLV